MCQATAFVAEETAVLYRGLRAVAKGLHNFPMSHNIFLHTWALAERARMSPLFSGWREPVGNPWVLYGDGMVL